MFHLTVGDPESYWYFTQFNADLNFHSFLSFVTAQNIGADMHVGKSCPETEKSLP